MTFDPTQNSAPICLMNPDDLAVLLAAKHGHKYLDQVGRWVDCPDNSSFSAATVYRAKPAPDCWIDWTGGECPVSPDVSGRVRFSNGDESKFRALGVWDWECRESDYSIVAYTLADAKAMAKAGCV